MRCSGSSIYLVLRDVARRRCVRGCGHDSRFLSLFPVDLGYGCQVCYRGGGEVQEKMEGVLVKEE